MCGEQATVAVAGADRANVMPRPARSDRAWRAFSASVVLLLVIDVCAAWKSELGFEARVARVRLRGSNGCTCADCADNLGFGPGISRPNFGICGTGRHSDHSLSFVHAAACLECAALIVYVGPRTKAPTGVCTTCGYDLAGLPGTVCPECGRDSRSNVRS